MDLRLRTHKNIHILDVAGEMDLYNAGKLRTVFSGLVDRQIKVIIVNLEKVTYIDSSGIGVLINVFSIAKQKKLSMKITNVSGTVKKVLELTRLYGFLPIAGTVEDTVRAFEEGPQGTV